MVDFILKKRSILFHVLVSLFTYGIWIVIYWSAWFYKKHKDEINTEELKKQRELQHQEYLVKKKQKEEQRKKEFQTTLDQIPSVEVVLNNEEIKRNYVKDFPFINFTNVTAKTIKDRISDYVVIDLETTGLSAGKNEILEISAIRFSNFKPIEKMSTLVKPKHEITEEITQINGITNSDVSSAPMINEVIPSFINFIGNFNLVGHNLIFDLKFLHANGFNIFESNRKYFDTLELSKKAFKDLYDHKLGTVAEECDIYITNSHRAEYDALATGLIFKEIVENIVY